MARTVIPSIRIYPGDLMAIGLTFGVNLNLMWFAPADAASGNAFWATGREVVLARNMDTAPHAVTVHSAPDEWGRPGDMVAYSVGAGEFAVLPRFKKDGWRQPDGHIWLDAETAEIQFAILEMLEEDVSLPVSEITDRGSLWFDEVMCSGHVVTAGV